MTAEDRKEAMLHPREFGTMRLVVTGIAFGFLAALWAALCVLAWIQIGDWLHGWCAAAAVRCSTSSGRGSGRRGRIAGQG